MGFGTPRKPSTASDLRDAPAFVAGAGLMLLLVRVDETHSGWDAGEEILLNYGPRALRKCKCNVCRSTDDDDDSSTGTEPERKRCNTE